jgi:hypothetical protein
MVYTWRKGFRGARGYKAETVGVALEQVRITHAGQLRPEDVVAAARAKRHPLHGYFTWDDAKAAEMYRVREARGIIGAVQVTTQPPGEDEEPRVTRAYYHIQGAEGAPRYATVRDVMDDPDLRRELVESVLVELRALKAKYKMLRELSAVWDAIDSV